MSAVFEIAGECDERTFRADHSYTSYSALKLFRESIPRYHAIYVEESIPRTPPSPAMKLGTVVHAMMFEREKLSDMFMLYPPGDGRTKAVKEARALVEAEAEDRLILTVEQFATAQAMVDAAYEHSSLARDIIDAPGLCEHRVMVEGEDGKIKAKFDKILPAGHIAELKTSTAITPAAFGRQTANMGYHHQAAHFEDVRDAAMGAGGGFFWFIVLDSEPPHRDVVVYEIEEAAKSLGRVENRRLLAELKRCREQDDWRGRFSRDVHRLELPRWAYRVTEEEE